MNTIPLDQLRFGHEANPPMNARLSGRQNEVSELATSITAHGLIQALTVTEQDGSFYVVDGNRRLAVFRHLASQGTITGDHPIRCDLGGGSGLEVSLAANLMRLPMHEADVYVTIRDLAEGGLSEADIASRFGIDAKRVRRMLVLGALATVVIDAWRSGKIEIETVRVFTLAPDLAAQEKAFADLEGRMVMSRHNVSQILGLNNSFTKELGIVGMDAYRAAGGAVVEDLFGQSHNILHPDLLRSLADARMKSLVDGLVEEGWSWAAVGDALPGNWNYSWQTLAREEVEPTSEEATTLRKLKKKIDAVNPDVEEDELPEEAEHAALAAAIQMRGYTEEIKAASGAVVSVDYYGKIKVKYAVVKPTTGKTKSKDATASAGVAGDFADDPADISMALKARLAEQLTAASQQAILSDPTVALAAMVATMTTSGHHGQPVSVSFNAYVKKGSDTFDEVFKRCLAMRDADLMGAFASALAPYIDMRIVAGSTSKKPEIASLLDVLDQAAPRERSPLSTALLQHFDATDYFGSAPKAVILAAIGEVSPAEAKRLANGKKKDLVAYALKNVGGTGWLPPELRTGSYAGPDTMDSKVA